VQSRGFLTFSDSAPITGNAFADLLLGIPMLTGGATLDNHQHLRTESVSLYLNDSFKLGPRLTVSAGLRYEYNSPPFDAEDRAAINGRASHSVVKVAPGGVT